MDEHPAGCALEVTAHPDDEAMFWAPTILALVERGLRVALLCLSTGAALADAAVTPRLFAGASSQQRCCR